MKKLLILALILTLANCASDNLLQISQQRAQNTFYLDDWRIDTVFRGTAHKSYKYYFVNERTGYVVSENYGDIWKTIDGGQVWQPQTSVAGERHGEYYTKTITFLDENTGFISLQDTRRCPNDCQTRYSLLTTRNGGQNWTLVQTESQGVLQDIHFTSSTEGVATAIEGLVTGTSQQVLLRTTDGGKSWRNVAGLTVGSSVYDMHFVNRLTGFIRGRNQQLFRTLDGGQTWALITAKLPDGAYRPYQFVDGQRGYMTANEGFYQTTNGGETWKLVWSGRSDLIGFSTRQEGFAIRTVKSYPNDIPDEDRELLRTKDGGVSWQAYPPVHNLRIPYVQFVSEHTGFFTDGPLIMKISRK